MPNECISARVAPLPAVLDGPHRLRQYWASPRQVDRQPVFKVYNGPRNSGTRGVVRPQGLMPSSPTLREMFWVALAKHESAEQPRGAQAGRSQQFRRTARHVPA